MKQKLGVWVLLVGVLATFALVAFYSLYNTPHRQVVDAAPTVEVQAELLYNHYVSDEARADTMYLDKVVLVSGVVEEILANEHGEKVLMLETPELFGVSCTMDSTQNKKLQDIQTGSAVVIKGICHGMLMDVVLVKCVLVNEEPDTRKHKSNKVMRNYLPDVNRSNLYTFNSWNTPPFDKSFLSTSL